LQARFLPPPNLTHLCFSSQSSITALHCLVSLLVAASRSHSATGVLTFCTTQLLPSVVELVARAAEQSYVPTDPRFKGTEEAIKAFVALLLAVPTERSEPFFSHFAFRSSRADPHNIPSETQSVSIILPVLILLLSPSTSPPPLHCLALNHLLSLAASHSPAFKEATAALPPHQRGLLEDSIRAAVGKGRSGGGVGGGGKSAEPKIELRLFG
jgi:hypothetical protein